MKSMTGRSSHTTTLAMVCGALAWTACTGELLTDSAPGGVGGATGGTTIGAGGAGAAPTGSGAAPGTPPPPYAAPVGMLRRLTRSQFATAMADIFGFEVDRKLLDSDNYSGDFAAIGAASVVTSEVGAERYLSNVEDAVGSVFADPTKRSAFIGCEPALPSDDCVRGYLENLGRRAWRRPLEALEIEQLTAVAETATTALEDITEGVRWATIALFSSPYFLYRPELGETAADADLRIQGYEMATRLAFLLWNSPPDDGLLDDAESGRLDTSDGVRAAAERLLDAPAGRRAVGAFAEEYMRLDRVLTQGKDPELFPEYGPSLQAAMVRDMREVWELVAFEQDVSMLSLFSTRSVVANSELAAVYGLSAPNLTPTTFAVLSLPEDSPRVGILGKLGFLSQFANQKEGSPTLRGKFIREALMCTPVEPPPGNVALELPEPLPDAPMTKRERLAAHRTGASCAICHALMDPMGLPFETFDAIGRYRTTDRGLPIDTTGEFDRTPVADSRQLGEVMTTSDAVANCVVRKVYTYALGHEERDVDATVVLALQDSFRASGYRLRGLLLDIVASEAFASVAPPVD